MRGGAFLANYVSDLSACGRGGADYGYFDATTEGYFITLRIAEIPEPGTTVMLALAAAGLFTRKRIRDH